jgi:hypothetical protein
MEFLRLPFFDAIADAKTVLLAGAGGGYDIFTGLPLYFGLRAAGKTVHLANLSFSHLYASNGRRIGEALVEVRHRTEGSLRYFPEKHLADWFHEERGEDVPIFGFDRVGARPVTAAYKNLVAHLGGVDAVILVDGGTDSLMRGDEPDLGTPQEDIVSLAAADALEGVSTKLLVSIGFGVDTFHGVCHGLWLENAAALIREGAYLGAWSVMREMPEAQEYLRAVEFVHARMFNHPSIVSSSIVSAIEGHFGNHHASYRTEGSELFINPLMSLYWAFRLEPVVQRNLYLEMLRDTETFMDVTLAIEKFRSGTLERRREWRDLPM